jgi:hypothetical protein
MEEQASGGGPDAEGGRAALSALVEETHLAASAIEEAFARTGAAIESSLASAARRGGDVFELMSQRILQSLADLAIERVVGGSLATLVQGAVGGLFGQRAEGGPVVPGGAYLVGERGPELFTPASAGTIEPSSTGAVAVHFHFSGGSDADAFRRSQGQIATLVARAVAQGRKRL